jgi:hypothetical protein
MVLRYFFERLCFMMPKRAARKRQKTNSNQQISKRYSHKITVSFFRNPMRFRQQPPRFDYRSNPVPSIICSYRLPHYCFAIATAAPPPPSLLPYTARAPRAASLLFAEKNEKMRQRLWFSFRTFSSQNGTNDQHQTNNTPNCIWYTKLQ